MPDISPMQRVTRIFFIGIGGSGMGGIAEVLHCLGYQVSGSDLSNHTPMLERLRAQGIPVFCGHRAEQVEGVDAVVVSSAIHPNNPELCAAKQRQIPIVPRAQMLAELMRFRYGIAIAGTHGKTTTTSLIASLFAEAGLDPTFIIGGCLNRVNANAKLGEGRYLIAEADESDGSFLMLQPMLAVVTNIDHDHLSNFGNNFNNLKRAFFEFIHHLPFYGRAILCLDDPILRQMLPEISRPFYTYGFDPNADFFATDFQQSGKTLSFRAHRKDAEPLDIQLNMAGRHNVLNALATIAVAHAEGLPDAAMQQGFKTFMGVGRRFESLGQITLSHNKQIAVFDDYGHHPKELLATIEAARLYAPQKRIAMCFQPHRFTRTADFFDAFVAVLAQVDILFILDIYPAGEEPISGIDAYTLTEAIKRHKTFPVYYLENEEMLYTLAHDDVLCDTEVLLFQGAGTVSAIARRFCAEYKHKVA